MQRAARRAAWSAAAPPRVRISSSLTVYENRHILFELPDLAVQLVERRADPLEHVFATRCDLVHALAFHSPWLGGFQPAALLHARQHRIQGARADAVAV